MSRITRIFAAALVCASCAHAQETPNPPAPQSGSQARSALTAELFYQLLLSEISLQNNDMGSAYGLMLNAARQAGDPQLFERAVEIALRARDANAALAAARAWQQTFPQSPQAERNLLQLLIGLNRLPDTLAPAQHMVARSPEAERGATITALARLFSRASDASGAADVFEKACAPELARRSSGPAAWAGVGNLRLLAKDKPAALVAAGKGHALNALSDDVAILALNLLDYQFDAAQELLAAYLQAQPLPEVRMGYARKLIDLHRYPQALAQVERINQEQPEFADAWLVRGSIEFQNQALAKAERSLTTYLALPVNTPEASADEAEAETGRGAVQAYFLLSQIAEKNKDSAQAQAYLARIHSPQDAARVQLRRAMILGRIGKLDEARALIRSLPETQSEDVRSKISAEIQMLRDNQQEQAAYDVLTHALVQFPGDADFSYELAMSAEKLGRSQEMETLLRAIIASTPDYAAAYNALGYALADRNEQLNEARQYIQKALQFAPDDPFILDSLGWVEFRIGNWAESLAILQKAFESRPDPEIAAHLGEVFWHLNQREQALAAWDQGLALHVDNETLRATIARLRDKP
ncbi:MAG: tetratricopeptide repeat protein [Betaproteobacteria bacterium]